MSLIASTVGLGLTVTVNVLAGPVHPLMVAVTLIVAMIGAFVLLVAVYVGILPVPLAVGKPKTLRVLVQLNVGVPPVVGVVKLIGKPASPLHKVTLLITSTVGVGFTLTVNVVGSPVHPSTVAVTLTVAVTGPFVALAAVNEPISPSPLVRKPTLAVLVQ